MRLVYIDQLHAAFSCSQQYALHCVCVDQYAIGWKEKKVDAGDLTAMQT